MKQMVGGTVFHKHNLLFKKNNFGQIILNKH